MGAVSELTPRLEVVEPGWLCIEARGPSRYFGGDAAIATMMRASIRMATERFSSDRMVQEYFARLYAPAP